MSSIWRPWRRWLWACCLVVAAGVVLAVWAITGHRHAESPGSDDDPRLTYAANLRNTRAGVHYVGDAACTRCHHRLAAAYHQHPMGRSLAPVAEVTPPEPSGPKAHNPFEIGGLQFLVERQGPRTVHKALRRDPQNRVVAEAEAQVRFAVGSGRRGRSYLIDRGGYLFQSPISWYAERGAWALSPHLAGSPEPLYRPVPVLCLFCHSNHAEAVAHTVNRYREPVFRGYAIGCERCHGPGELHVRRHEREEAPRGADDTIVNPGRLPLVLREAVCQQCHLQGVSRVLRRGRQPFDFRPGLPLHSFWSVFVRPPGPGDSYKFSSHVEQMQISRCFRAGKGELGCISCHNPHELPPEEEKVAYYRSRCLNCHAQNGCAVPAARRRELRADNSCTACHMPRRQTSNIAHMASTDHRIVRRAGHPDPLPAPMLPPDGINLVLFHQDLCDPADRGFSRDRGVALTDLAGLQQPERSRLRLAGAAVPVLQEAVQADPDDVPAWQGLGYGLWLLGRKDEALDAFEAALARAPRREETLVYTAAVLAQVQRDEEAIAYLRRALEVNPWSPRSHVELAKLLVRQRQWKEATHACESALRLDPFDRGARQLLITCRARH
jgi:hypothetical protein